MPHSSFYVILNAVKNLRSEESQTKKVLREIPRSLRSFRMTVGRRGGVTPSYFLFSELAGLYWRHLC
jgi:hypothetical protein